MPDATYTASMSRSNRPGWSVSFRHPLRRDARGKLGLRMRRGLGTTDGVEAERLVKEMNILLMDRSWWNASKRTEAKMKFSKVIVDAFYDEIQAGREDPVSLREELLPLPTAEDGYSRVLFVGTTGAGKTSLLRQLIGSDPGKDRFPSTAPGKTTIADIEVVQSDGNYQAVVTFFTEFQVQANVEECIVDACRAVYEEAPDDKVADRLLNHRDQKFRLSYVLGGWYGVNDQKDLDDDLSFEEEEAIEDGLEDGDLTPSERAGNSKVIEDFLNHIKVLTEKAVDRLEKDIPGEPRGADREAFNQLIDENLDEYLTEDESFHELIHEILDRVRERFDLIEEGTLERCHSDWPQRWQFETSDRERFIGQIRWFSSNYGSQFGRLLTPLVCGIRVKGPLFPMFTDTTPRLVLIDGQGLGHTPDSTSSVTTHVTKRFDHVDVVLLVDNAKQAMQAAPLSVLRYAATSGHSEKLAVAFTHFDQIKGPALPTLADKRGHVMASVLQALSSLGNVTGTHVVRSIEDGIDDRCFMLGGVDQKLSRLPHRTADYMRGELMRLVKFCEKAILPPSPPEACPIYDPTGLAFAVQESVAKFQSPWLARLDLAGHDGVRKEHWSRIKALSRRIAAELDVEYDTLQPVADLLAYLTEAISRFLDNPIAWTREPKDEQERQTAIAQIRRKVSAAVHELALRRLVVQSLAKWREAYDFRGKGSTFQRARTIRDIYDEAAPAPDAVMQPLSKQFLAEVRRIVTVAIKDSGGQLELAEKADQA